MTGKHTNQIAVLRRQARSNMAKVRELEQSAAREMRVAISASNSCCRKRAESFMDDARAHCVIARQQYREAAKLESGRRETKQQAAE